MDMEVFGGVEDENSVADADGGRIESAQVDVGKDAMVVSTKMRVVRSDVGGMVCSCGRLDGTIVVDILYIYIYISR